MVEAVWPVRLCSGAAVWSWSTTPESDRFNSTMERAAAASQQDAQPVLRAETNELEVRLRVDRRQLEFVLKGTSLD